MYVDSCGKKGIGETPQCEARGGSPAARGKRSIFPERGRSSSFGFYFKIIFLSQPLPRVLLE
ncbi:hypothetical protein [Ornithinibacillus sp. FSL M8-0202]|uniref:hypothetical protein n=1 Tax=Ornithinibacillus sp. FSL M8-0202 TaxID=2921616 RepID=UPI0030D2F743